MPKANTIDKGAEHQHGSAIRNSTAFRVNAGESIANDFSL
jgi:hypothetical protein